MTAKSQYTGSAPWDGLIDCSQYPVSAVTEETLRAYCTHCGSEHIDWRTL